MLRKFEKFTTISNFSRLFSNFLDRTVVPVIIYIPETEVFGWQMKSWPRYRMRSGNFRDLGLSAGIDESHTQKQCCKGYNNSGDPGLRFHVRHVGRTSSRAGHGAWTGCKSGINSLLGKCWHRNVSGLRSRSHWPRNLWSMNLRGRQRSHG